MQCLRTLATAVSLLLCACQSYINSPAVTEGRAASAKAFSDPLVARAYQAKPTMRFPARIAVFPEGEAAKHQLRILDANGVLDRLNTLPHLASIVPISSLLVHETHDNERNLDLVARKAAARFQADAVFIVKVEQHISDGAIFAPLSTFTLGLFPNHRAGIICTALGALVDTRTGYVYGTLERSAAKTCFTNSWDQFTRKRTVERAGTQAMLKLFGDIPDFWRGVVHAHRQ